LGGGVTVIDIIFVDPIPTLPVDLGGAASPGGKHPLNNGWNDGDSNGGQTGTTGGTQQQHPPGGNSGSTGTAKPPAQDGGQSAPPPQGNNGDDSDSHTPQGKPLIVHGDGSGPPVFDPQNPGGSASGDTSHPSTPAPIQGPAVPVARPAVVVEVAPAVTPLALTPARGAGSGTFAASSAAAPFSITPVISGHEAASTNRATGSESATAIHMPSQIAATMPPVFAITKAIEGAVPAAARAVTQIEPGGALVAGAEAVTVDAIQQSLPARATYNFIRFDAASFQDAVAAFANELATLTKPAGAHHSTTRAWIITGTVLGLDAIFLGYWHLKARKQNKKQLALARAVAGPRRQPSS